MICSKTVCTLSLSLLLTLHGSARQQSSELRNSREWEDFVDGVIAAQQKVHHFAGAVVVVVSNGQVAFKKGYGYSDFAERKPVDPSRTLFRVASNSKMFVWTAVMQLVEQGTLDLQTDVNQYLTGLQVPPTFPEPITLEHLMTHTPGFEDKLFGLFARTPDKVRPLLELMRDDMPARVFAPGTVPAYSNYGTALAALIVEQLSGLAYEQYIEERILAPLGMLHATIRQPVPSHLAADLSKGYRWANGRLTEQSFEYVPWAPAGAMSVSGEDMGRFMLAHLGDGTLGDGRILRPETARVMREKLTSFSPKINGMLHGFIETGMNGQNAFGHSGATIWFHSFTGMLPDRNLGVFVAYNTDTGQPAVSQFVESFFDRYFPTSLDKEPAPSLDNLSRLDRFTGAYVMSRASSSDLTTLIELFGSTITVDSDGYLVMRAGGDITRWRQVEPLLFAEVDGKRQLVFRQNERGEVIDLCTSPTCVVAMLKRPWFSGTIPQLVSFGLCILILVVALLGFPVAAVSQRSVPTPAAARVTRVLAWVTSLAFVAGLVAAIAGMTDINGTILFGMPAQALNIGLGLLLTGSLLSAGLVGLTFMSWRRSWWRVTGRACITIVCVAAVGATVWLYQWNLLGWRF